MMKIKSLCPSRSEGNCWRQGKSDQRFRADYPARFFYKARFYFF
jgi:hypothetical protein